MLVRSCCLNRKSWIRYYPAYSGFRPKSPIELPVMGASTHLNEEFRKLPKDNGPTYHELRHGELVTLTRPKLKHSLIQRNLRRLLEPVAEPGSQEIPLPLFGG